MSDQAKTREGVYIAIPSRNGSVSIGIVRLIARALDLNNDPSCPYLFKWGITPGLSPTEYARNVLVRAFLETDCQKLFFIDDDMRPSQNWPALLEVDADIVSGCYLQFDYDNEDEKATMRLRLLAFKRGADGWDTLLPEDSEDVRDIDAAGCGCMVIRRRVFEDQRMLHPTVYTDNFGRERDLNDERDRPDWAPTFFPPRFKPNAKLYMTEDLPFCQRAKDLGYTVKLCQKVWFSHDKTIDLNRVGTFVTMTAREAVRRGSAEARPYDEQLREAQERNETRRRAG